MPGSVHPHEAPRGEAPQSEVRVWEALRDLLPDGWTAWHSLRLRGDDHVFLEGDFLVASPDFGLLAVEVKGGRIELRDGVWVQNGTPLRKPPLTQALHFIHALDRRLKRDRVDAPPFGAAVMFPDVEFSAGPGTGDLEGVVLGALDLPYLDEALRAVAARAVPDRRVPPASAWMPTLSRLWGEQWVPHLSTRATADAAHRRLLRLNDEQLALLEMAGDTPRAFVAGAAGTGKTLVARELCRRRAQAGQRVLYVCFTKALAAAVRRDFEEASAPGEADAPVASTKAAADAGAPAARAGELRAANVRQLAVECIREAGRTFDFSRPGAWEEVGFEGADAAQCLGREPYDVTVVDEAFDLSPADWMLVEVLSGGRDLWAFSDPRQHFWPERSPPESLFRDAARLRLPVQHRNPPAIERFAALYARTDEAAPPAAQGPPPPDTPSRAVRVVVAPGDDVPAAAAAEVRRWRAGGARPDEIAVVTLAGLEKTAIVGRADLCGEPIAAAESDAAATHVVADTFLRFKGFERPFVIVTELGGADGPNARSEYDTRMYIALTRATAEVVVVCTAAEAEQDGRLVRSPG